MNKYKITKQQYDFLTEKLSNYYEVKNYADLSDFLSVDHGIFSNDYYINLDAKAKLKSPEVLGDILEDDNLLNFYKNEINWFSFGWANISDIVKEHDLYDKLPTNFLNAKYANGSPVFIDIINDSTISDENLLKIIKNPNFDVNQTYNGDNILTYLLNVKNQNIFKFGRDSYPKEFFDYLIQNADLNFIGSYGFNVLMLVSRFKEKHSLDKEQIDYLIHNTDLKTVTASNLNALIIALTNHGNTDLNLTSEQFDYLIHNSDLTKTLGNDKNKTSILHTVAFCNLSNKLNLTSEQIDFIIRNSDLKSVDKDGWNALMAIFRCNSEEGLNLTSEQFDYLIKNSDLKISNEKGYSPLYVFLHCHEKQNIHLNKEQLDYLIHNSDLDGDSVIYFLNNNSGLNMTEEQWKYIIDHVDVANIFMDQTFNGETKKNISLVEGILTYKDIFHFSPEFCAYLKQKEPLSVGYTPEKLKPIGDGNISQKAEKLGLHVVQAGKALQRDDEISTAVSLLKNHEHVMVLGNAGTGKTTLVQNIALELDKENKTVIEIPADVFNSSLSGGVSQSLTKIIDSFSQKELDDIVFFMDEIHSVANMGVFGDGSNDESAVRNLLKPYLTDSGSRRITMIGATTTQEYQARLANKDPAFCRRFHNLELQSFSLEQIKTIMGDNSTIDSFIKSGLQMSSSADDLKRYEQITSYGCELLDQFARYQAFPEKSAKFFKALFAAKNINDIVQSDIEQLISKTYHIPMEIITKEISADSVFFNLSDNLKAGIVGQNYPIEQISSKVMNFVASKHTKPLSFLAVGDSGVGKTQTAEDLASKLDLPFVKFNMGEYKTSYETTQFVEKLSDYLKSNYTGVILFDELEKANPDVLDAILSLTDKGQVGSGNSLVTSTSQIIFMTSNMIKNEFNDCSEVLAQDGIDQIPEELLRQFIEEGTNMRTEFIGRIDSILHFKNLSLEDSLKISSNLFNKKVNGFTQNGIQFEFDEATNQKIVKDSYEKLGGVRVLSKNLDNFFQAITSNQQVILHLKNKSFVGNVDTVPNHIKVSSDGDTLHVDVNGTNIDISYKQQKTVDFNSVLEKMRKFRESKPTATSDVDDKLTS